MPAEEATIGVRTEANQKAKGKGQKAKVKAGLPVFNGAARRGTAEAKQRAKVKMKNHHPPSKATCLGPLLPFDLCPFTFGLLLSVAF